MRKGLLAGRFAVVVMAGFGVLGMLVVVAGCQSSNDAARSGSMLESSPPSDGSGKGTGAEGRVRCWMSTRRRCWTRTCMRWIGSGRRT